jgi:hypothetical protein
MNTQVRATSHAMVRLDIPTTMNFGDFRRAFEAAAPAALLEEAGTRA